MNQTKTWHKIFGINSQKALDIEDNSIDLVVTSPPYPMIEMWDKVMASTNDNIQVALMAGLGKEAYELMHLELDKVWEEVARVLKPGGIACINIGDATRTINGEFALYPNHSRIISKFLQIGFNNLPNVIWRKQTNAPNKFMGSGMLPAGAYVTLEHEWILIFRKGGKRPFVSEFEKNRRRRSSFFWEERNVWFSDLWEFKGVRQYMEGIEARDRSAAFPFELPYRLINMYSLKGDVVYDPFLGTGTTTIAALVSERSSIGMEIDRDIKANACEVIENLDLDRCNLVILERIRRHCSFISTYQKEIKHYNDFLKTQVMTSQEKEMSFSRICRINKKELGAFEVEYKPFDESFNSPPVSIRSKKQIALGF